ncbi:hypothetical protein FIBSPDRAFT_971101 [Athelia psychrophila]|uniref:Plasmid pRiA4b Orf3-like domain-containing protein n=1 Tax=Athelia psychrophila TaxID=1759441 RepID=A0A166WZ13_9AGAM|nr:hypothetical protein FIBSPDRAFT_971101 [Fibularhizoctonia sp. CBS 109695]
MSYGRRIPKFVKLHPKDRGDGLDDVFFEDPGTFVPPKNAWGEVRAWGVLMYDETGYPDWDVMRNMMRTMGQQMNYMGKNVQTPERQFVDALIKRKEVQLKNMDLGDLRARDYILRVTMIDIPVKPVSPQQLRDPKSFAKRDCFGEDLIYRRFKVSGGMNLDTFQDKVLQPIMGWARNAHAFALEDLKDGACFGPKNSGAIDMMHAGKCCVHYVDANKYTLAHMLQRVGEKIGYTYDFGDKFLHNIQVEEIKPAAESDGSVVVLEGRGMCPPEDNGRGNRNWAEDIYNLKNGTMRERNEIVSKVMGALNYRSLNLTRSDIDPARFSVFTAQNAVHAALGSPASVRTGAKVHHIPMREGAFDPTGDNERMLNGGKKLRKGETIKQNISPGFTGLDTETISTRRDNVDQAACAKCGSPHNLKACSVCKMIFYW